MTADRETAVVAVRATRKRRTRANAGSTDSVSGGRSSTPRWKRTRKQVVGGIQFKKDGLSLKEWRQSPIEKVVLKKPFESIDQHQRKT